MRKSNKNWKKQPNYCRLCGEFKELSYEHIPPKSAFNDNQVIFQTMEDMSKGRYTKRRQGMGIYGATCAKCNNLAGGWYAPSLIDWTKQSFHWLDKLNEVGDFTLPYYIQPLNVIKQIAFMSLAMTSVHSIDFHRELRLFLLNPERKYLPDKYKIHVYFNPKGSKPRFTSDIVVSKVDDGLKTRGISYINAEVALPPFGYCLTNHNVNENSLIDQIQ